MPALAVGGSVKYVLGALAVVVLILGIQALGGADAPAALQKWEFKMVASSGESGMDFANAEGKEGWELVAVQEGWLFLKRPLK